MKTKRLLFEFKSIDRDTGAFTGYASVYGNVDRGGDVVANGAFTRTMQANPDVPILWQHNMTEPIGVGSVQDSQDGLVINGQLNLEVAKAREAFALMKQGAVKGLSIGYDAINWRWDGNVRVLEELRLWEVSVVTFPMNELATVTAVKSTGYTELPIVDAPWNPAEAEARVTAWAGDDATKHAAAFLAKGDSGFTLLVGDVVDDKLVLNKTALQVSASLVLSGNYPDEVKDVLSQHMQRAGLADPFKKAATFERMLRKMVTNAYLTVSEVKTGRALTEAHTKLIDTAIEALQALKAAAPIDTKNSTTEETTTETSAPVVETPAVPQDSDSDQAFHSLIEEMRAFTTSRLKG